MAKSKLEETHNLIDLFEYLHGDWIIPPQFLRWSMMSLIAACVEDRVSLSVVDHAPIYPNLWVFLISGSGDGKDMSIGPALALLKEEDPLWMIDGKITMPAMYDYMASKQKAAQRNSAPVFLVSADITEQLPAGPEAKDFTSRAYGLYGGRERVMMDITRTSGTKTVKRPLLNWIAGCVKDWFPLAIDPQVFVSGFAGRAFFIVGEQVLENYHKAKPTRRHDHDLVMDLIRSRIEALQQVEGIFLLSPRAEMGYNQCLEVWKHRLQTMNLSDIERTVMKRARTTVLKLAMIYTLADWEPGKLLVIKGAHMSQAIQTVQEVVAGVIMVSDYAYVTVDTAAVDKVRDIIHEEGTIQRERLLRIALNRGVKGAKALDEILDTLKQAGYITMKKRKPAKPGGRWPIYINWKRRTLRLVGGTDIQPQEGSDGTSEGQDEE